MQTKVSFILAQLIVCNQLYIVNCIQQIVLANYIR